MALCNGPLPAAQRLLKSLFSRMLFRDDRQQHRHAGQQCRARLRKLLCQPGQLLRAIGPQIPALSRFTKTVFRRKQGCGVSGDQDHRPSKGVRRQNTISQWSPDLTRRRMPLPLTP